jgi:hypothetical protein
MNKLTDRDRKAFLWTLFLVGLAILVLAVASGATTLTRLSFNELARQATAIVRVRCLHAESVWKDGEIWTRSEFAVVETNKGTTPRILDVEMPGGSIGHLHARVEEVPRFVSGEELYLFLWATGGSYRVLGWSQGTFRIRKDRRTGAEGVTQDSSAEAIFDPASRQFRRGGVRNLSIAAFELKLQRALENQ